MACNHVFFAVLSLVAVSAGCAIPSTEASSTTSSALDNPAFPQITSVDVDAFSFITIHGTDLVGADGHVEVTLNGLPCSVTSASATNVTFDGIARLGSNRLWFTNSLGGLEYYFQLDRAAVREPEIAAVVNADFV